MRRRDESDLIYRRSQSYRQDYRLPKAHLPGRTASPYTTRPAGAPDGCRRERGVFLSIGNRLIHN